MSKRFACKGALLLVAGMILAGCSTLGMGGNPAPAPEAEDTR